ncbi:MAG: PolC-type DNA polymerase III [Leptothrix sp. (in: b-proteobacteria)]
MNSGLDTFAVIDFETTGMTPAHGARATEIGVVLVRDGQIVGQYESLMRSGAWVSPFIEELTGISNAMLEDAPPAEQVMREVSAFTRGCGLVAHNAAFDRHFWLAEQVRAGCADATEAAALASAGSARTDGFGPQPASQSLPPVFACTLLLARRLYPEAPNHKLGTLARYHALPDCGRAHRALADATITAHLLIRMQRDVEERFGAELADQSVSHALLTRLQRAPKEQLARSIASHQRVSA